MDQEVGEDYRVRYVLKQINITVNSGILIDEVRSDNRDLIRSINQQSHIKLSSEEYDSAYYKLHKKNEKFW